MMSVEVFVLMVTDPKTGVASPVVVNESRPILEKIMEDGKETLELQATMETDANKALLKQMSDSYTITTGLLKVDGYV